jgi:hypothetical protein
MRKIKKTKYVDFLRDRDRGEVIKICLEAATTEQLANRAR